MLKHHSWSVHAGPAHSYKFVNEGSFFQNTRIKQTIKEKKDKLNNAINKNKKKLKQGEKSYQVKVFGPTPVAVGANIRLQTVPVVQRTGGKWFHPTRSERFV